MKDIKKIIKLDYISIVPYFTFKNLIIMIFLYCFYFVVSKNPAIAISMPLIFAIIYSSYPFLVGDEAGLDGLYKIFGIKNRDVVIGRYIFAIILFLFAVIIGLIFTILSLFLSKDLEMGNILPIYASYFLVYIIMICIQYPIFFKYGYTKGRTIYLIPVIIIGILGFLGSYFDETAKKVLLAIENNKIISFGVFLLILIIIIFSSIKISEKNYNKRDF